MSDDCLDYEISLVDRLVVQGRMILESVARRALALGCRIEELRILHCPDGQLLETPLGPVTITLDCEANIEVDEPSNETELNTHIGIRRAWRVRGPAQLIAAVEEFTGIEH